MNNYIQKNLFIQKNIIRFKRIFLQKKSENAFFDRLYYKKYSKKLEIYFFIVYFLRNICSNVLFCLNKN